MYLVVLGCGKLGSMLANLLSREKHNIVVIDKDSAAFQLLDSAFNGITILGNGIDVDVQRKAGVDGADAFVAVSGNDATNLMAAQVARRVYHVPKVVARVSDSENESLYHYFGIETVFPIQSEAIEIRDRICTRSVQRYLLLEKPKLEVIRAKVKPEAVGKTVEQLSIPGQVIISLIIRADGALVPKPDTPLKEHDEVIVTLSMNHAGVPRKWLEI